MARRKKYRYRYKPKPSGIKVHRGIHGKIRQHAGIAKARLKTKIKEIDLRSGTKNVLSRIGENIANMEISNELDFDLGFDRDDDEEWF